MATRRILVRGATVAAFVLTGCSALIDINDIYFDENGPVAGRPDGGGVDSEDGAVDPDADTSCQADTDNDSRHCGRCNHDCLGGTCEEGRCTAVKIASIPDAPLRRILGTDTHLFVSTFTATSTQPGGIWRIPKAGGPPEHYVTVHKAEAMTLLGQTLYFTARDARFDDAGETGGLYSCPLATGSPCTPTLVAPADNPLSATADQGKVYFPDQGAGNGIMAYAPSDPEAVVFRAGSDHRRAANLIVEGEDAFYTRAFSEAPVHAALFHLLPDSGRVELLRYDSPAARDGVLLATPDAFYVTMHESDTELAKGFLRRVPRVDGLLPCEYGGRNQRPFGVHVDASRVYWTNMGEGRLPYTKGAVVSCELEGCCTDPDILWASDARPAAMVGDDEALYWIHMTDGTVWKIAKP
jgi:hypothetical protein